MQHRVAEVDGHGSVRDQDAVSLATAASNICPQYAIHRNWPAKQAAAAGIIKGTSRNQADRMIFIDDKWMNGLNTAD
jgi:hypothetical protein